MDLPLSRNNIHRLMHHGVWTNGLLTTSNMVASLFTCSISMFSRMIGHLCQLICMFSGNGIFPLPLSQFQKAIGIPLQLYAPYWYYTIQSTLYMPSCMNIMCVRMQGVWALNTSTQPRSGNQWSRTHPSMDVATTTFKTLSLLNHTFFTTGFLRRWTAISYINDYSSRYSNCVWGFSSYLFLHDQGLKVNMVSFEPDFMNQNYNCVPEFVNNANASRTFQLGMSEAGDLSRIQF